MQTSNLFSGIVLIAEFLIGLFVFPRYINYMKKLRLGQYIRQEGPDLHNYKEGTPTAGGIVFLAIALVAGIVLGVKKELLLTMLFYGFIGFLDDFVSIAKKRSLGLRAWQKLALQMLFSIWVAYTVLQYRESTVFGFSVPKWFFYIFTMFLISGYSNATNLTDGLDGLAGWVFITSATPFLMLVRNYNQAISLLILVMPLLAFLVYNTRPAKVFMGDTGSLALGAYIATYALITSNELPLIFFTSIFLLETISVILQVGSYKIRGKRIFKMAPIHHHFELLGWTEEKIVGVFSAWNLAIAITYLSFVLKF
ncbi:Phospho-N-acetylmuramoyl-pentapeptide-transferase [Fervidobacterium changbaicum]|uniref:Phospho-N-acetylmuramoyl-pentapeptide-transferase n=2 Tax=Fervidobacterium TaxID=2422 RepID=A0AAI8CJZ3_FERIS|nr:MULTISPECIES: phospho-N-acetylmuramoyl-pentapeptide-transferase [Fervidobacterium]AMW32338.1 phospho-N-acetylmuramoyl-pentapeptide-transferase [Fervidobacterium islandicum]QAV32314.1 phospho-N-acetylmuramoyl-pentapeptide-transferase [Fervidobacterium changbaicum]QAV34077.1 phospho-N-acetylmuramoyl-pentapeptide-transferase [Fervidobacterium changbaicum]SDH22821.1 Phospho-N-acetylmuramoyl-pentapeptide-transferase [Fervidobacterium changbaicum]